MSDSIAALTAQIQAFVDAREWRKYHNAKDLAVAITAEAGELMQHFVWQQAEQIDARVLAKRDEIASEIADARLAVLHRVGSLGVGDVAVVCAASTPHRAEAFQACRLLIDRIKARVPIWKREHGPSGPYWVGWEDARCEPGSDHDHNHDHDHDHDQ